MLNNPYNEEYLNNEQGESKETMLSNMIKCLTVGMGINQDYLTVHLEDLEALLDKYFFESLRIGFIEIRDKGQFEIVFDVIDDHMKKEGVIRPDHMK